MNGPSRTLKATQDLKNADEIECVSTGSCYVRGCAGGCRLLAVYLAAFSKVCHFHSPDGSTVWWSEGD